VLSSNVISLHSADVCVLTGSTWPYVKYSLHRFGQRDGALWHAQALNARQIPDDFFYNVDEIAAKPVRGRCTAGRP
jgi:hypothetical protein